MNVTICTGVTRKSFRGEIGIDDRLNGAFRPLHCYETSIRFNHTPNSNGTLCLFIFDESDMLTVDRVWLELERVAEKWRQLGVGYLLGYNEPDGHVEGQTCGPDEAVEAWIWVQKIANLFDPPLILVSPTPISGASPGDTMSGFHYGKSPWLDEFFEKCEAHPECVPENIKYIAFHDYEGDFKTRDDNLQVRINNIAKNYGRKIWLTEVSMACTATSLCRDKQALSAANPKPITRSGYGWPKNADDSILMDDQLAFLHEAIPYLESNPNIFRYAVFGTRYKPTSLHGYIDQLPYDSDSMEPTCLGQYYKDAPHGFAR